MGFSATENVRALRSFQRVYDTTGQSQPNDISAYDDIGTSYHYNLHAIEGVRWGRQGDNPWASPGSWADRGRALVRDVHGGGAGTFVLFVEDGILKTGDLLF